MIHLSKNKRADYFYRINKARSTGNWFFIGASLLVFLLILLIYEDVIPSKSKFEKNIYQSVAKVITPGGTGSAFLVGKTYLLTARHVVKDINEGDELEIIFEKAPNGSIQTTASLAWKNQKTYKGAERYVHDYALLKLDNPTVLPDDFPRNSIGVSKEVDVMQDVILVGYPGASFSITKGAISNTTIQSYDLFKVDAGAWPGSSGGPLINKGSNEVIGILVAGRGGEFKGINMACKIDNAINEIERNGIDVYK